ncbi:MAG: hypothetical protein FWH05_04590 [Oscillospiraceae bacterium]|nr:hypothetical protein [Oscillospiraceae bacterium]
MKKTRMWNFEKVMLTLQTVGPGKGSEALSDGEVSNNQGSHNGTVTPITTPTAPSQATQKAKEVGNLLTDASKGALGFLKVFAKNPIGAMLETSLGFKESIIFAVAQALGLALTLLVLTFRGWNSPIVGLLFVVYGNVGGGSSRFALFFQAIFICAILLVILTAVTLFFGKVVFKGTFDGSSGIKKLIGYILTAQIPLTFTLVVSIIVGLIAPPLVVALVAMGVVAAIVLGPSVFSSVFGLTENQSAYATISTYSVQILVFLLIVLLAG